MRRFSLAFAALVVVGALSGCDGEPSPADTPRPASSQRTDAASLLMPDAISCGDRATRKIGDEPHYVNYVSRWRTNDGCQVRLDFAMRWNGGCWENVDDILLGWPLGATHRHHHHIYLRDPNQILGTRYAAAFDPDATLPENAMDTGLRQHETELWLIPNHDQFVWLVQGDSVERWPHVTQEFGCA